MLQLQPKPGVTHLNAMGRYSTLFKCCSKRVADYPNLAGWLRDVYQLRTQHPSQLQVRACLHATRFV